MPRRLVSYFEIPATDLDRAVAFYQAVFHVPLERTVIDGHPMALFPESGEGGITGALCTGDSYEPSRHGTRVYFAVDSIDDTLESVLQHGGRVLYPKTSIGELGHVAEFEDSEGNRVALSSP